MKKIMVGSILSAFIIGIIVWGASFLFSFSYVAWSFCVGLGLSVVIYLFNSSGGPLSNIATFEATESTWKVQKNDNKIRASVGVFLCGSVLYTIFSLIVMVISYY